MGDNKEEINTTTVSVENDDITKTEFLSSTATNTSSAVPTTTQVHQTDITKPTHSSKTIAIISLIFGIIGLMGIWVPFLGIILGIIAIIFGIIALLKNLVGKGLAISGVIIGCIVIIISIFALFFIKVEDKNIKKTDTTKDNNITYSQELQDRADRIIKSKKNFSKGETGIFGDFEIKVNYVERDYQFTDDDIQNNFDFINSPNYPISEYLEFILLNITVKNTSIMNNNIVLAPYEFYLTDNSEDDQYISPAMIEPMFIYSSDDDTFSPGDYSSGNLLYVKSKKANGLKIKYESYVHSNKDSDPKSVFYTLEI